VGRTDKAGPGRAAASINCSARVGVFVGDGPLAINTSAAMNSDFMPTDLGAVLGLFDDSQSRWSADQLHILGDLTIISVPAI
jgi:hypothetical protein